MLFVAELLMKYAQSSAEGILGPLLLNCAELRLFQASGVLAPRDVFLHLQMALYQADS